MEEDKVDMPTSNMAWSATRDVVLEILSAVLAENASITGTHTLRSLREKANAAEDIMNWYGVLVYVDPKSDSKQYYEVCAQIHRAVRAFVQIAKNDAK